MRVLHETAPVRAAAVVSETMRAVTDVRGEAKLPLEVGRHTIRIERLGFVGETVVVDVLETGNRPVTVRLRDESLESGVVVVTASRSGTVIGDQPVRVEALPDE